MFFCRFVYFCSAIFVLQFLFRYFCSAGAFLHLKPHLPHYLIDNICSADLFALALTNFCSAIFVPLFLFRWGLFALKLKPIFVPLFLFHWGLFLFRYFCSTGALFCSAIFVLLGLFSFRYFCSTGAFFVPLFLFCWGLFLFCYFCSAIFVPLTFLHLHLPIFVPLFLFRYFCSTGAFLHLNLNQSVFRYFCSAGAFFCSAIFVPLTFLHLHLPIFVPLFLFRYFLFCWGLFALKPHLPHYLIDNFCSTDSAHQFLFH